MANNRINNLFDDLNNRPKKIANEKEFDAWAEKNPYLPPHDSFTSLNESAISSL